MLRILTFALAFALMPAGKAAETIVGPAQMRCSEVTRSVEQGQIILMWVIGYVSGANSQMRTDLLDGVSGSSLIDRFRDFCLANRGKSVLDATVHIVDELQIDALAKKYGRK